MAWVFTENVNGSHHVIAGEDAHHIGKVLRVKPGECVTLCDEKQVCHECTVESVSSDTVTVKINESHPCVHEPDIHLTLYQALPKGEKMDMIVQKSIELGVAEIVPVLSARCISRPDEKSIKKKVERWNKIAKSAAMQSRRGFIPTVKPLMNFKDAAMLAGKNTVICYELGGVSMDKALENSLDKERRSVSLFIGSEGGFEQSEVDLITQNGGIAAGLGRRILRAETAPLAAASVIMYLTGNLS
ncbi:MAG: 16S rRNA (uracil(1498)-N(3))-methyltransferase [Clostridia bacterium]|nr:16S rRNA (uracil(1498)-N(3))-methyltransferase [Clostridia bacterium]